MHVFRITCVAAIFLGAQADFSIVWNLADVTMGLMAIVNIIAIFLLGKIAIKVLKDYENQKKVLEIKKRGFSIPLKHLTCSL